MISSDAIIIRTPAEQISSFQRPSKGVKVMRVNEGEKVATISIVDRLETDELDDAENIEADDESPVAEGPAPTEDTEE